MEDMLLSTAPQHHNRFVCRAHAEMELGDTVWVKDLFVMKRIEDCKRWVAIHDTKDEILTDGIAEGKKGMLAELRKALGITEDDDLDNEAGQRSGELESTQHAPLEMEKTATPCVPVFKKKFLMKWSRPKNDLASDPLLAGRLNNAEVAPRIKVPSKESGWTAPTTQLSKVKEDMDVAEAGTEGTSKEPIAHQGSAEANEDPKNVLEDFPLPSSESFRDTDQNFPWCENRRHADDVKEENEEKAQVDQMLTPTVQTLTMGCRCKVLVTEVFSPSCFIVQLNANMSNLRDLELQISQHIQNTGVNFNVSYSPKIGDLCIAELPDDGVQQVRDSDSDNELHQPSANLLRNESCKRGKILAVRQPRVFREDDDDDDDDPVLPLLEYDILFVDHGYICNNILQSKVRALPARLLSLMPLQAVECRLAHVRPKQLTTWSTEAGDAFFRETRSGEGAAPAPLWADVLGVDKCLSEVTGTEMSRFSVALFKPGGEDDVCLSSLMIDLGVAEGAEDFDVEVHEKLPVALN